MLLNYKDLQLDFNKTVSKFNFNNFEIEVINYLPIKEKYDLVMTTIQKSKEGFYYNTLKLNMFFKLHLVYMYTNIVFSQEDYQDEGNIYDLLESSGFFTEFLKVFPKEEYDILLNLVQEITKSIVDGERSAGAVVAQVVKDLPMNAEKAMTIFKDINPDTFKNLIDTANSYQGK